MSIKGVYITLTTVILVDFVGEEHVGDAVGVTFLFMGFAVLIGPPLLGGCWAK